MKNNILLVDDDASIRFVISKSLSRAGYKVQATDNVQTLLKWVKNGDGDIIISDVHLGSDEVFNFLPEIRTARPQLPVIIISANTNVMTAMKSSKHKVFEYLPKPFDLADIEKTIVRALGRTKELPKISAPARRRGPQSKLIGKSMSMQPVFRALADFTSGDIHVHIHGAPGTGKSLAATLLHEEGARAGRPLVYFEQDGGAADWADAVKNGDLLVDRIDELPAGAQAALLKLLETNEQKPRGDRFRLVSLSRHSFPAILEKDLLRADLIFYLSGGQISLPPLYERSEDIGGLAQHFLAEHSGRHGSQLGAAAIAMLETYSWPGNVRELSNFMQKAHILHTGQVLTADMLQALFVNAPSGSASEDAPAFANIRQACHAVLVKDLEGAQGKQTPHQIALAWVEKPLIEEALKLTGGNNLRAAELLGIHRNTLRTKLKALKIG